MRVEDLVVEYRDINLQRQGAIPSTDLDIKIQPVRNGVGTWQLSMMAESTEATFLRQPGTGIIVTDVSSGDVIMSGPTLSPTSTKTSGDPQGMVTISGVSDDRILWDAKAWPNPNLAVDAQTDGYDVRSGPAETVMIAYVQANVGILAPSDRRSKLASFLTTQTDLARGISVTKSARFPGLGDLLNEIATVADLRFRVVQRGSVLVFEIDEIADKTGEIRLDVNNGTLDTQSVQTQAPTVTRVIVAGQGQGADRTLLLRTSVDSLAAEDLWGIKVEDFKDQRNTDDLTELQQAGDQELADGGFTSVAVKAVPSDDQTMIFMKDWNVGDKVTVVVDGQETTSVVTEGAIVANSSGLAVGAAIGDVTKFNSGAALQQQASDTQRRVSDLEKTAEAGNTVPWSNIIDLPVSFPSAWSTLSGIPTSFPSDWSTLSHIPASFPSAWSTLSGIPAALPAGVITTGANLNSFTTPGVYMCNTNAIASGGTNFPAAFTGVLTVRKDSAGIVYQEYQTYGSDNHLFYRATDSAFTFQPWKRVSTADDPVLASITTFGAGFTGSAAPNNPRILREGNKRTAFGEVTFGSGSAYSNMFTVPAADQPPTTSSRVIGMLGVYSGSGSMVVGRCTMIAGVVGVSVSTGSIPAGTAYLAGLTWYMD
jgi:hypothetical protein